MAENKKGFILYADQKELFSQLPDEIAGKLIKHIMAYVNDENPISDDILINIAFTPIKLQLKRDLVKFEETKDRRSVAGKIGAEKRWQAIANDGNRINGIANDSKPKQTIAKIAVKDNVNVKVKDIHIYRSFDHLSLSQEEFEKLVEVYTKNDIDDILDQIENNAMNKKYTSLYLTTKNWLKRNEPKQPEASSEDILYNHVMAHAAKYSK
jgi:ASC-1-like (ASCH) protein